MIDFSKMEGHTPGPWEKHVGSGRVLLPTGEYAPTPPCDGMLDGESWSDMRRRTDPAWEAFLREEHANHLLANSAPIMKDEIIRQRAEDQYKQAVINDISRDNDRLRAVIDELVEALEAAFVKLEDIVGSYDGECYTAERLVMVESAIKKAKGNE